MDRARPRSLYLPPGIWKEGQKRAKRHKMGVSRYGWLCCERAAREAAGHALSTDEQLDADMQRLALFGHFTVSAADGREVTVLLREVLRFLHLPDSGS